MTGRVNNLLSITFSPFLSLSLYVSVPWRELTVVVVSHLQQEMWTQQRFQSPSPFPIGSVCLVFPPYQTASGPNARMCPVPLARFAHSRLFYFSSLSLPLVKLPTFALQSCPVAPSARVSRECRISGWMVRVTSQYDDSPYVFQHARSNEQRSPGSRCARNGTWREPGIGSSRDQINIYSDINICKKQLPLISIHVVVGLAGSERASRRLVCVCPGAHRR